MPKGGGRGKKTHKGQRRHFTNEEDLVVQAEKKKREQEWRKQKGIESDEEEEGEGDAKKSKPKPEHGEAGTLPPASSEESSEEESSEEEEAKAKGVSHLIEIENPNRNVRQSKKVSDLDVEGGKPELSRREREELEKQQAAAHYRKLHESGKTDEARADLARLALIRKQREETAKKKEEERKARDAAKEAAEKKLLEKKKQQAN